MPCTLTGSREGDLEYWLEASHKEITQIAQLLCKACALLEKEKVKLPKDLKTWWTKHQKIDEERNVKSKSKPKNKKKGMTKKVR